MRNKLIRYPHAHANRQNFNLVLYTGAASSSISDAFLFIREMSDKMKRQQLVDLWNGLLSFIFSTVSSSSWPTVSCTIFRPKDAPCFACILIQSCRESYRSSILHVHPLVWDIAWLWNYYCQIIWIKISFGFREKTLHWTLTNFEWGCVSIEHPISLFPRHEAQGPRPTQMVFIPMDPPPERR